MNARPLIVDRSTRTLTIDHSLSAGFVVDRAQAREMVIQRNGLPGPPGTGSQPHTHAQSTPSTLWTVNHNLGFRPVIEILSAGGVRVDADVLHLSANQAQISFNTPQTGTAIAR